LEGGVGPIGLSELEVVTGHMKLKISLVVCVLMVVACSANDEQSELVTVQAATPTTPASTTAAEVVDPPDIPALKDDSDERQPEVDALEPEADAGAAETEAAIDDLKAEVAELEAAMGEWDDILADPLMVACGAEAVLVDFVNAFIASSVVIDFALGAEDPLVIEYYATVEAFSDYISTEANMSRIYAAIDALTADERTIDMDWTAVRSAFAAVEEFIDCMARSESAPTTAGPESAEGVPTDASLYIHEALCRAAGYEWTNPDTTTGTFCTE